MLNTYKMFIFTTIVFLFLGCGEESNYTDSLAAVPVDDTNQTQRSQDQFNGIVVDGYIKNSTVCFDIDMDGVCSSDEQLTTTDTNGIYNFNIFDQNDTLVQIIATGGVDTSTDRSFEDKFITVINTDDIAKDDTILISPITDLVAHSFLNSTNKTSADLSDAKSIISQMLGLSLTQLEEDPMLNIDIFAVSQKLQHTKLLLEEVIKKNITEYDSNIIQNEIKRQMIELDLNIENILIALKEGVLNFAIPQNEEDFVIAQANELTQTLNSLAKDTSLDIDNLNRLQKSLDLKQQEAYVLIREAEITTILDVVDINITNESLTQTNFNTTNAEYDENACISNGFNVISNNAFSASAEEDIQNGLAIRSRYEKDVEISKTEVTLYSPSLSQNIMNNDNFVFEDDFYFSYDSAWVSNAKQTIYIKTPEDAYGLNTCYRYELNSTHSSDITPTKVFSYTELN